MTLFNCIATKMKNGMISAVRGKAAQKQFQQLSHGMIQQGTPPTQAYALAAQTVVQRTRQAAAQSKHRLLARYAAQRNIVAKVRSAPNLKTVAPKMLDDIDFQARAIHRMANGRISEFLITHSPDVIGRVREPMRFREFLKALAGEATTDAKAKAFADAVNDLNEWFRTTLNGYGYNINKLDGWSYSHKHDPMSIGNAGLPKWSAEIKKGLDWTKMVDPRTGQLFQQTPSTVVQDAFLKEVYDNIVYGRSSRTATWGRRGAGNSIERHRVLQFKSSDAWIEYNKKFGAADPFNTLMNHIDHMSREVALAKNFGPDTESAVDYMGQYLAFVARQNNVGVVDKLKIDGSAALAKNMARYMTGGVGPNGYYGAVSAKFFSTTRKGLSAALLDRAVVISVPSDLNSMQMAARAIKMNPENALTSYFGLMQDSLAGGGTTRDDLLRLGHIADSFANQSVTMARYEQEFPAATWANILSNASMQIQGLSAHTDNLKMAFQKSMGGHYASNMGKAWNDLPDVLRKDMADRGAITPQDWDDFRLSNGHFTAQNGAVFLDPLYWRGATNLADPKRVDDVFLKFQSYTEKWTELAVPSGSLIAKGLTDPLSYGMAPGSLFYELAKSAGMFKSFVGAFLVNQVRMVNLKPTMPAKVAYVTELLLSTTVVGMMGIQIGDMLLGRDPQDMRLDLENADFWGRAVLRGGGLGPIGDILSAGTTSWGGGIPGYVAGPVPGFAGDSINLTAGNIFDLALDLASGEEVDTNFWQDLARYGKRYMPLGQTPAAAGGAAFDRLIWDQLQLLLDPDSVDALAKASQKRKNLTGAGEFWLPGQPTPTRLPDLGTALGR